MRAGCLQDGINHRKPFQREDAWQCAGRLLLYKRKKDIICQVIQDAPTET